MRKETSHTAGAPGVSGGDCVGCSRKGKYFAGDRGRPKEPKSPVGPAGRVKGQPSDRAGLRLSGIVGAAGRETTVEEKDWSTGAQRKRKRVTGNRRTTRVPTRTPKPWWGGNKDHGSNRAPRIPKDDQKKKGKEKRDGATSKTRIQKWEPPETKKWCRGKMGNT